MTLQSDPSLPSSVFDIGKKGINAMHKLMKRMLLQILAVKKTQ